MQEGEMLMSLPAAPDKFSASGYWFGDINGRTRLVKSGKSTRIDGVWTCDDCKQPVKFIYWVTGHDHRDETCKACDCELPK